MSDRLEAAASGRARCRACGVKIDKGAMRFGEELPHAYGEGEAPSVLPGTLKGFQTSHDETPVHPKQADLLGDPGAAEPPASLRVYWFHPRCAAHRRPERIARVLQTAEAGDALPERSKLLAEAELGIAHARLPRIAGAERSTTGRARCRHCRELISGGGWRIKLSTFEDSGFFEPLGFIHAGCARSYFDLSGEPADAALTARLCQASSDLDDAALAEMFGAGVGEAT